MASVSNGSQLASQLEDLSAADRFPARATREVGHKTYHQQDISPQELTDLSFSLAAVSVPEFA